MATTGIEFLLSTLFIAQNQHHGPDVSRFMINHLANVPMKWEALVTSEGPDHSRSCCQEANHGGPAKRNDY